MASAPRFLEIRMGLPIPSCAYVNQVQRQQTWNLPDPVDPEPIGRNIGVYFTRLHIGGIDFAILEDRKFKTGPAGKNTKDGASS